MTRSSDDSLRKALLMPLESASHQLRNWIPTLRKVPDAQLREPTGSKWGSVIGVLAHVVRTDQVFLDLLQNRPVDWQIKGLTDDLEECFVEQARVDAAWHAAVADEPDLGRPVRMWWGTRESEFEVPLFQLVMIKIEHLIQHRGNVDSAIKRLGIELMTNSVLELHLHRIASPYVFAGGK